MRFNPSTIPGLILRLRSGQAPGVCPRPETSASAQSNARAEGSGLILSGAFYLLLKAGVWRRRSINILPRRNQTLVNRW